MRIGYKFACLLLPLTEIFLSIFLLALCANSISSQDVRKELKAAKKSHRNLEPRASDLYWKVLNNPDFIKLSLPDQLDVYDTLGWLFHTSDKFLEAEPLLKKAVGLRENDGHNSIRDIKDKDQVYVSTKGVFYVNTLMFLGETQLTLGKFEESRVSFKKALTAIEIHALQADTDKWACLVGIARSYYRQNRYAEALPLYETALTVPALYNGALIF